MAQNGLLTQPLAGETKSEWKQLLRPGILKAVVIGVCIAILGQFMGVNAVLYYGPSMFKDAGMSDPLFCQVLVGVVNMLTTVLATFIIDRVGRHKLIYYGVSGMIFCLIMIAAYFAFHESWGLSVWFMLTFFLLYVFCCAVSISAVVFVLLSEMYPQQRARPGHVDSGICSLNRNLPHRTAHPLDARDAEAYRHILALCRDVCALYTHHVALRAGDCRHVA